MGKFRSRQFESDSLETNNPDVRYDLAYKRVKRIKGFYIHLIVYIVVNVFIIVSRYNQKAIGDAEFWHWETFSTALFWAIGVTAHGLSVFGRNIFFGRNWEEKKIKDLMEKEKNKKWE